LAISLRAGLQTNESIAHAFQRPKPKTGQMQRKYGAGIEQARIRYSSARDYSGEKGLFNIKLI